MKLISIVTPCYCEEENVDFLYNKIKGVFDKNCPGYEYEHIFIDNASTDNSVSLIKKLCEKDHRVKLIVNARNFGHIRSPFYGIMQARGDAVVLMASDLQDPPELLPDFIQQWESGFKLVLAVKKQEIASPVMRFFRRQYYNVLEILADVKITKDFTGFGLYDRTVVEQLRDMGDSYPYLRGLVSELGYDASLVEFVKPQRRSGISHNNFYTLYDMAMLGVTSHTKIPLRLATMFGFVLSALSILIALGYLTYKLLFWNEFVVGMGPLVVGLFFFSSVQLFFLGIVGEYVGAIHTQVLSRPLVIEKERVNFDS